MANNSSVKSMESDYRIVAELLPIALTIAIANSVVFFLFIKEKHLRTPTNYLLLSLAVCDFMNGVINIPLFIVAFLQVIEPPGSVRIGFFVAVLHNMAIILMVYHVLAVTLERYFSIARPFKHRQMTKKTTLRIGAAIWLIAAVIAFMPFTWFWRYSSPEYTTLAFKLQTGHTIFCMVFVFLVPYVLIIYSQVVIFRRIRNGSAKEYNTGDSSVHRKVKNEKRCLTVFALMALNDGICWLPWYVLSLIYSFWFPLSWKYHPTLTSLAHGFLIVRYLTSVANPVLYTFFKMDFLLAFKETILRRKSISSISQYLNERRTSTRSVPLLKVVGLRNGNQCVSERNVEYMTVI